MIIRFATDPANATAGSPPPASLNANPAAAAPAAARAASATPSSSASSESDPFAAQDAEIDAALSATPSPPASGPSKPAAKPAEQPAVKPPEKPAAQPAAKPKVEGIDQVRGQLDRVTKEHSAAQTEVNRLKSELETARRNGEATTALTQELAAAKRERDTFQQELRMARYEPSEEVKNVRSDFNLQAGRAKRIIESLKIVNADGTETRGNWGAFQKVFVQLEPGDAAEAIEKMFGENTSAAHAATQQYWDMFHADEKVQAAETKDRAGFQHRVTTETATRQQAKEGYVKMVSTVENDLRAKKPEIFAENPDDPEGNAIFQKGMRLANQATDPAQYNALSPQQQAVVAANVRLMVGAHPRLVLNNGRLKAENAALKAKIAELEGGALPPETRPGGAEHQTKEEGWEKDFDRSVEMA